MSFLSEIYVFFVRIDELDYVTIRNINVHVKIRKYFRSITFACAYIFYGKLVVFIKV